MQELNPAAFSLKILKVREAIRFDGLKVYLHHKVLSMANEY